MSSLIFYAMLYAIFLFLIYILNRIRKAYIKHFSQEETRISKSEEQELVAIIYGEYVFITAIIYFSVNIIYNNFIKPMI